MAAGHMVAWAGPGVTPLDASGHQAYHAELDMGPEPTSPTSAGLKRMWKMPWKGRSVERLDEIFHQIRVHGDTDQAHRVWEVVGKEPDFGQKSVPCYVRFASLTDRCLFGMMRFVALIDVVWVPILLCFGHLEWDDGGPFAPGGLLTPHRGPNGDLDHYRRRQVVYIILAEIVMGILYTLGTSIRLVTSTVDVTLGKEFVEPGDILMRQLNSYTFWADVVSLLGESWWMFGTRWLAALRLLRIWRLPSSSYRAYEITMGQTTGFASSCAELLGSVWLVAHIFGCCWFFCMTWPFATYQELHDARPGYVPRDIALAYLQCLGEGVAMIVGWQQPIPPDGRYTVPEQLFCITGGPVASMFLAFVFARLLVALDHAEEGHARFRDRITKIATILQSLNMPSPLCQRVVQYHAYLGVHHLDKAAYEMVFNNLSWNLHVELKLFLFEQLVLTAPFFHEVPPPVVMSMVKAFDLKVFSPGDMVVKKGEVGSEMFFIVKGAVDIMVDDEARVKVAEKRMGDYFGEVALVFEDQARTAWVCASAFCVLAMLTRTAFKVVLREAPEIYDSMVQKIRSQQASTKSALAKEEELRRRQPAPPSMLPMPMPTPVPAPILSSERARKPRPASGNEAAPLLADE